MRDSCYCEQRVFSADDSFLNPLLAKAMTLTFSSHRIITSPSSFYSPFWGMHRAVGGGLRYLFVLRNGQCHIHHHRGRASSVIPTISIDPVGLPSPSSTSYAHPRAQPYALHPATTPAHSSLYPHSARFLCRLPGHVPRIFLPHRSRLRHAPSSIGRRSSSFWPWPPAWTSSSSPPLGIGS